MKCIAKGKRAPTLLGTIIIKTKGKPFYCFGERICWVMGKFFGFPTPMMADSRSYGHKAHKSQRQLINRAKHFPFFFPCTTFLAMDYLNMHPLNRSSVFLWFQGLIESFEILSCSCTCSCSLAEFVKQVQPDPILTVKKQPSVSMSSFHLAARESKGLSTWMGLGWV